MRPVAVRIGWTPRVVALIAVTWVAAGVPVAARLLVDAGPKPEVLLGADPRLYGLGAGGGMLFLGALAAIRSLSRVARRVRGRTRLGVVAWSALVHVTGLGALLGIGARGAAILADEPSFLRGFSPPTFFEALPVGLALPARLAAGCAVAALVVLIGGFGASWFLVPERGRRRAELALDVALVLAFFVTWETLPLTPPEEAPDAVLLPAIRLTVTAVFAARVAARLVPPLMNEIERLGFRTLVAARHLRARKSGFLATIGTLAILAVALSCCSLTTTLSVMGGFRTDLKRKILGNHAHVVVEGAQGKALSGWARALDVVRGVDGVEAAAPFVGGEVMVTSASNLSGAVLRGILPEATAQVTDLDANIVRGRLDHLEDPERLRSATATDPSRARSIFDDPASGDDGADPDDEGGDGPADPADAGKNADTLDPFLPSADDDRRDLLPGIVVGQELARTLRLFVGDDVDVVSPLGDLGPAGPIPKSRPFRVAGIFYSGMYEYDMKYAYVQLDTAQRFLSMDDGAISGIEVKVDEVEDAPRIAEAIRRSLGREDVVVQDWQELNRNLFGALALERVAMFVALGIAIIVAGFCVFGTLTLMVQEKGREVAILKAMGADRSHIVSVFLFEGLLIGLFGAAVGLGLGYVVCFWAANFGVGMNPEVYYIDRLPVHVDGIEFALVGVASVLVCVLATVFPAIAASRLHPVEELRYE